MCGVAVQIRDDLDRIIPKELKFPLVILGGIQVPVLAACLSHVPCGPGMASNGLIALAD